MSLQIAVAHTGQRLDADPVAFGSVDALKRWVSRATEIPPESQILLTPGGKHVKLQALLTEVCGTCLDGVIIANVLLL
jgi:autophagy-related protein 11